MDAPLCGTSGEHVPLGDLVALCRYHKLGGSDAAARRGLGAYFDRSGTYNGPTEAIDGRLEHLRGSVLGFRNLTNYIARCLLETGGFSPRLHPGL